ncbi:MAG: type II toxin-antitoxin system RelE/ParE family toxin [Planctomycetes bacterium]|nr:type II toxin-antitoxin system RelE/ParE family toxin [Planctomycetota bacterium]
MKPLGFAPRVEAEIEAAGDYYEAQRTGLGLEFLDAIDEGLLRLVERPRSHPFALGAVLEEEIRQVFVRRFPYRIVFREREGDLLVLACMHARREPGYWRSRGDD